MRRHLLWPILVNGAALCLIAQSAAPGVLLGILEDTSHRRSVRAVFERDPAGWKAFPSDCPDIDCLHSIAARYPQHVNWTIGFDGRAIGKLTARTPGKFEFYSEIGQQTIDTGSTIPTIGKPAADFAGWQDEPVYRPLVSSSRGWFRDPDGWKPSQAPAEIVAQVRQEFRRKYPKLVDCDDPPKPSRDSDIRQMKSYASRRGWRLVQLSSDACAPGNDGGPLANEWFVVKPAGAVSYLASNMWLVDAGDYDNDGSAEVIFVVSGYNRGGYRLYYADFTKSAAFEFSYH